MADATEETSRSHRGRHRGRTALVVVGSVVAIVAVVVLAWVAARQLVNPDEPSAFYSPPDPLPTTEPGAVLRTEPIPGPISGVPAAGASAQRVLYVSTGPDGEPITVSGTVVRPAGEPPPGGWPVVAWAHGTTGVAPKCAPSLDDDGGLSRIPALEELLAAGNVVVATDYPGLGTPGPHPYLVGESEGRAVLDSVRAADRVLDNGTEGRVAIYGHSQGGHAALFAGQIAPTYAPELQLAGVAAMAPPTDLATLLEKDRDEALGILLTALAVNTWSQVIPGLEADQVVHADMVPVVDDLADGCVTTTEQSVTDLPEIVLLDTRFLSRVPQTAPGWKEAFAANSPSTPLGIPVLVAQGLTDSLVRPEVTESYVKAQCAAGGTIELHTYPDTGHFGVRTVSTPYVAEWLLQRTGGAAAPTGCSTVD